MWPFEEVGLHIVSCTLYWFFLNQWPKKAITYCLLLHLYIDLSGCGFPPLNAVSALRHQKTGMATKQKILKTKFVVVGLCFLELLRVLTSADCSTMAENPKLSFLSSSGSQKLR